MIEIVYQDTTILAMEEGKTVGKIEFSLADREMSILHTYAYESGRGIGSLLMRAAVEWAGEHKYTIVPICTFAQKYLEKK
jgi:predicted GNAT family acetyltransferase